MKFSGLSQIRDTSLHKESTSFFSFFSVCVKVDGIEAEGDKGNLFLFFSNTGNGPPLSESPDSPLGPLGCRELRILAGFTAREKPSAALGGPFTAKICTYSFGNLARNCVNSDKNRQNFAEEFFILL